MQHDWILDVLADLKAYAHKNGLPALARELDEATLIAATETASTQGKPPLVETNNARSSGYVY
jgi:hypothetical protein